MIHICRTCKYFKTQDRQSGLGGECRYYPPKPEKMFPKIESNDSCGHWTKVEEWTGFCDFMECANPMSGYLTFGPHRLAEYCEEHLNKR